MKLDYDCVRELLIWLEQNIEYSYNGSYIEENSLDFTQASSDLGYTEEEIVYTSEKLVEAGYITAVIDGSDEGISICNYQSVTFAGHEYINAVKSDTVWCKVKSALSESTISAPIDAVKSLASAYCTHLLKSLLGIG